ncbi:MAG: hypothetical protein ACK4GR_04695, partial [bacterium]
MVKKYFSLVQRIKSDNKFIKKERITLIDDLESFRTFLSLGSYRDFEVLAVLLSKDLNDPITEKVNNLGFKNFLIHKEELEKYLGIDNSQLCALVSLKDFKISLDDNFIDDNFIKKIKKDGICLFFDNIQNPWNLG